MNRYWTVQRRIAASIKERVYPCATTGMIVAPCPSLEPPRHLLILATVFPSRANKYLTPSLSVAIFIDTSPPLLPHTRFAGSQPPILIPRHATWFPTITVQIAASLVDFTSGDHRGSGISDGDEAKVNSELTTSSGRR